VSLHDFPLLTQAADAAGLLPYLDDPLIREIRVTSAGRCFVIHSAHGKQAQPDIAPERLDAFLALAASMLAGPEWRASSPRLAFGDARVGFRIQAARPPVSPAVNCVIRKHPSVVFPLSDFLTPARQETLCSRLQAGNSIIIAGAVGSGKTSLLNSLLAELQESDQRIIVLEDTPELVSRAPDTEYHRTVSPDITLRTLCRDLLRNSPDVAVVGEIRGGESLELLKAFQTGTQGLGTVHADSAINTLLRFEMLNLETSVDPQRALIAEALDVIVHMERCGMQFRCTDMVVVEGLDTASQMYITRSLA
jgi:type IV secretion system protein TrbB